MADTLSRERALKIIAEADSQTTSVLDWSNRGEILVAQSAYSLGYRAGLERAAEIAAGYVSRDSHNRPRRPLEDQGGAVRDPRVEPMPGDNLRMPLGIFTVSAVDRSVQYDFTQPGRGPMYAIPMRCKLPLKKWRERTANAEVIARGEE